MQHLYHSGTIKSLYAHSGNRCAFPGCNQELVCGEDINISEICHIYGLNQNSARYVEGFDEKYLNSEENLILLCPSHHKIIDSKGNEEKFPVQVLLDMKLAHESYINLKLGDIIANNKTLYFCDYAKVKQRLKKIYGIDYKKKEVEIIGESFSCQDINVRRVMRKILDIMHRNVEYKRYNECGVINMLMVLHELCIDISTLASLLKYLEMLNLIKECNYTSDNLNSLGEDAYGNLIDISDNYIYKVQNGEWIVTKRGMVLDAIYIEQNSL